MRVRSLVAVATALVAGACVVAGALVPAAADTGTGTTGTAGTVTTVPFEVSGELPIYPKALWRNGDDGTEVRELEARLVQLGLLDKRWLDDSFGTMTRAAVRTFQRVHGIPALGYVDQYT